MPFLDEIAELIGEERYKLTEVQKQAESLVRRADAIESKIRALEETADLHRREQAGSPLLESP